MIATRDLERSIRLGEDSRLDLERVLLDGSRVVGPRRELMADAVAAMANSRGGTIVLGVDGRTRTAHGIPPDRLDAVVEWMTELCHDSVNPPIGAVIRRVDVVDLSGRLVPVVRVDVPDSLFVHQSPGGFYRRTGSSNHRVPPDVLARILQERSGFRSFRFDESIVSRSTPGDLDPDLTIRFQHRVKGMREQNLLRHKLVDRDDHGAMRLTVAGALLCTRSPVRWLPYAYIQAVRYVGERRYSNYPLDAVDLSGPLDSQIMRALHFVRRNMSVIATKSTVRTELPQYSDRAVFEALVNAVAHRDYSMAGARIRLHMFDNRIELYVPGSLANTLTIDSMAELQYCRNELIVSLLARCPVADDRLGRRYMMERRGDGVPIILDESHDLSGRWPEYTLFDDSELRLIIWAADTEPAK